MDKVYARNSLELMMQRTNRRMIDVVKCNNDNHSEEQKGKQAVIIQQRSMRNFESNSYWDRY